MVYLVKIFVEKVVRGNAVQKVLVYIGGIISSHL